MVAPAQASLHQLNAAYDAVQDRILLRASTSKGQEFRFWITRRFMGLLWQAIGRIADNFAAQKAPADPMIRAALAELAQEKALQAADFNSRYEAGTQLPLGEAPLLLARIEIQAAPGGRQILRLLPERGQGIDLGLDENLTHILASLLRQAAIAGEWELDLGAFAVPTPPTAGATPRRLH
jgi:hypothetical protein